MSETSEVIKNRMIKRAAALWGVPANEIEISFDPVVTLLLGACASEIEKIHEKMISSSDSFFCKSTIVRSYFTGNYRTTCFI